MVSEDIMSETGVKHIFARKFNQDPLENGFAQVLHFHLMFYNILTQILYSKCKIRTIYRSKYQKPQLMQLLLKIRLFVSFT